MCYRLLCGRMEYGLERKHGGHKDHTPAHSSVATDMKKDGAEEDKASNAQAGTEQHKNPPSA